MNRSLCKRLLSFVLAAAMLISLNAAPAAVWAAEMERPITATDSKTYINPAYAHLEPPVSDGAAVASTDDAYAVTDAQEAAALLKETLLARGGSVAYRLPVDFVYDAANTDPFWAEVWAMEEEIYAEAVAHTGNPQEGDYIRYNLYKREMKAGASFGTETTVTVSYVLTYNADAQQEQEVCDTVDSLLTEWALTDATDYEKVCAAYDWLCQNVDYVDTIGAAPSTIYSSYGAIVEKDCVCQGYAVSLYRLLLELGVDCRVISGTDDDGGKHAWNIVELDGAYYNVDATWDTSWLEAGLDYAWFLKCDANFPDHIRGAEFTTESFDAAYPMAGSDYDPSQSATSGTCGDSATWSLENGVLTISGTGAMYDYQENGAPWQAYAAEITQIVIEDGVTYIGDYAFYNYTMWDTVDVPASVTSLGSYAFQAKDGEAPTQVKFTGNAPVLAENSFGINVGYVRYPYSNSTWDQKVKDACGSLILEPYDDQGLYIDMGAAGHDLIWILDSEYTLKLIGSGRMEAYFMADMPWVIHWNDIQRIELPDGLTNIRHLSFCGLTKVTSITIPSTVTEIGMYAISSCGALESIYFTGNAPVIEEFAFSDTTATVYYPAGNETWTEDIMQQYEGALTWVSYEVGAEELFELDGANLALEDGLNMNFFVEPQKVAEGYYAVITRSYADGRADHVITVPYAQWNSLMGEVFYVTYTGIAAKEMGDTVSVVIYNAEGEAVSKPWNDSVQVYAVRRLNDNPVEAMETLLVDMLNYGAAAQLHFGYNTANLVNDVLTDAQKACATASYETESNMVSGIGRAGTALSLKNRITLDFIFSNSAIGSDYTGLYAIATYTDHYGETVETRIDAVKAYNAQMGYVSVPGLAVADYGQAVTCTVYDAEGNVIAWATDSIEGYAHRMAGKLPAMVDAILKFCTSSYTYFH